MRAVLVLAALVLGACHPKLSAGYDASAHVRGPLANLSTIPRIAGFTGDTEGTTPAPEGRTVNAGLAFGDRNFQFGIGLRANNIAKSTLDVANGPQYLSAAASLDFRYTWVHIKNFSTNLVLAPTRTVLVDSANKSYSWGNGLRYGAGMMFQVSVFGLYADLYQEKIVFGEGPAFGDSTRTGVSLGLSFQP
ncbi:MAG: hypothetical protein ABI175_13820 [Polyangiales bacterium]